MARPENYCGCCGRINNGADTHFCRDCLAHTLPANQSAEYRTWFAQHGTACPFEDA